MMCNNEHPTPRCLTVQNLLCKLPHPSLKSRIPFFTDFPIL